MLVIAWAAWLGVAPGRPSHSNRLIKEKSPYLLQHAHNPVEWYPWGEEAFAKAKKEGKPIFLSIGYSTCHWCHVMERESFEDEAVAKLMNKDFVSIKVDREERPDIDQIYMTVCQAMTGGGGWPLTIIMTPEKKPFFAGTYFPKDSQPGRIGMVDLLSRAADLWKNEPDKLTKSADSITQAIQQEFGRSHAGKALTENVLKEALKSLTVTFDEDHGGVGIAPKFPTPHQLTFLLRMWSRTNDPKALEMVEKTLMAMRQGGIFDQVGFGFHRYSTDQQWLLPHFEKMLYDQALIALAALETYQATHRPLYAQMAREIFTYVLRDMTDAKGGFYCAEDADSEGEEGKFYLWSKAEILKILGKEEGEFFCQWYQVVPKGNYVEQATGVRHPVNIPHLEKFPDEAAAKRLEISREKLFEVREKRIHPHKDDKILTDWNGLMVAALARGAQVLNEPTYAQAAERAAQFVFKTLQQKDGRLLQRYRDGAAAIDAPLEAYAFFAWGLMELYEVTFQVDYLVEARRLTYKAVDLFWDKKHGGLFLTPLDQQGLIARPKDLYDGATPSGNSVMALNLIRLARLTMDQELEQRAQAQLKAFAGSVESQPTAHTFFLHAVDFALGPSREVVIAGDLRKSDTQAMFKELRSWYLPRQVVVFRPPGEDPPVTKIIPFIKEQRSIDGKATAYVCENFACQAPTTDVVQMKEFLKVR